MKFFKSTRIFIVIAIVLGAAYYLAVRLPMRKQNEAVMQSGTPATGKNDKQAYIAQHYPDSLFTKEYLTGKFNPAKDSLFLAVDDEYAVRTGLYLRRDVLKAFINMHIAAKDDGISLKIVSATRNFQYQKGIWDGKWNGSRLVEGKNLAQQVKDPLEKAKIILRYSAMPGTSRHHWGTDIDINSMDPKYFESPKGKKEFEWLKKNAAQYGFCQPYTPYDSIRPTGHEEEKWHWSYVPLASACLDAYVKKVSYDDLRGFAGSETAPLLDVIKNYVSAVNPQCR
jgi:zinc D-Ala-D-Ala carboxypeptidase